MFWDNKAKPPEAIVACKNDESYDWRQEVMTKQLHFRL